MLKKKLSDNEITVGGWITIGHPSIAEIMAESGFDWLVIDMEHTSIDYFTAQIIMSVIQAKGIEVLVRVPNNDEVSIKKALDIGADGIIIPMINSKQDAISAVEFAKYPPHGKRGVGLFRAQGYGYHFDEYKKWIDDELVIIAQIEHIDAVNELGSIIEVNGIDGVIVGPYDLSGSMGFPGEYDRADVANAIEQIISICKRNNFPVGFHSVKSDYKYVIDKIKAGCHFMVYSVDFFLLGDMALQGLSKIREDVLRAC